MGTDKIRQVGRSSTNLMRATCILPDNMFQKQLRPGPLLVFSDDISGQVAAALYDAVAKELAPYTGKLPLGVQRATWVQRSVCFSDS